MSDLSYRAIITNRDGKVASLKGKTLFALEKKIQGYIQSELGGL